MRPHFWKQLSLQPIFEETSKSFLWDLCIRTKPGVRMTAIKTWAIQVTSVKQPASSELTFKTQPFISKKDESGKSQRRLAKGQRGLRSQEPDCTVGWLRWEDLRGRGGCSSGRHLLLKLFIWKKSHRLDDSQGSPAFLTECAQTPWSQRWSPSSPCPELRHSCERDGQQEGLGKRCDKGKPSTSVVSPQSSRPCLQPYARLFSSIRHGDNSDVKTAYKTAQESGLEMIAGRSHQSGSSREKTESHQPVLRWRQKSSSSTGEAGCGRCRL